MKSDSIEQNSERAIRQATEKIKVELNAAKASQGKKGLKNDESRKPKSSS